MTKFEELTNCMKKLSQDAVLQLFDIVNLLLSSEASQLIPECPHCGNNEVIRYGHKRGKQRFLCKHCGKTFITTTHTIMSHSHFGVDVWKEIIQDTIYCNAMDYSAKRLELNHQKPLPKSANRKARKHGAKAEKREISSEYGCICTDIQGWLCLCCHYQ